MENSPRPRPLSEFSFQYYFFLPLNPLKSTWPSKFSDFSPIRKLGGGGQLNSLLNQRATLEHCFSSIHFYSWATRKSKIFHGNHMLGAGCTASERTGLPDCSQPRLHSKLLSYLIIPAGNSCDGSRHNPTPHT